MMSDKFVRNTRKTKALKWEGRNSKFNIGDYLKYLIMSFYWSKCKKKLVAGNFLKCFLNLICNLSTVFCQIGREIAK